jgi:hypothetical protein
VAAIDKQRAHILKLVFGAAFLCCLAGCMGPLVYRPEKKPQPIAAAVTNTNKNLPPMPDIKANNATLAGIDSTGIGIRDDVQNWIFLNYTTKLKRTIFMTMAKTLQDVMVNPPKTTDEARNLEQSYKDASIMLKVVRGLKQSETAEMHRLLYIQIVNTPQRLKAYLQYNLLLAGGKPKQ